MTWAAFWWPAILGAIVTGIVHTAVGLVVAVVLRRLWRRRVRPLLIDLVGESVSASVLHQLRDDLRFGALEADLEQRGKSMSPTTRHAITAGVGVVLTGVAEYLATSTDLEQLLEQVVPQPLVPLVPIVFAGVGAAVAIRRAGKRGAAASAEPPTLPAEGSPLQPAAADATPPDDVSTAAAGPTVSTSAPYWAGITAAEPVASTSIVQLPPAPERLSFQ